MAVLNSLALHRYFQKSPSEKKKLNKPEEKKIELEMKKRENKNKGNSDMERAEENKKEREISRVKVKKISGEERELEKYANKDGHTVDLKRKNCFRR